MLDRATFLRPTAHRGLHDAGAGIVENTKAAFEAAIAGGYAIECDLQTTRDHIPVVFHDDMLDRLIDGSGPIREVPSHDLDHLLYKGQDQKIMTFEALLNHVAGRVPLLVELKSDWRPPDLTWLNAICRLALAYSGPVAVMSYDPVQMAIVRDIDASIPRGIVSRRYRSDTGAHWWPELIDEARAERLTNLGELGSVAPDFIAYHVKDLDIAAVAHARDVLALPLFAWTVRSDDDKRKAEALADAAIFEGYRP